MASQIGGIKFSTTNPRSVVSYHCRPLLLAVVVAFALQVGCAPSYNTVSLEEQLQDIELLTSFDKRMAQGIIGAYDTHDCLVSVSDSSHGTRKCVMVRFVNEHHGEVECWEYDWARGGSLEDVLKSKTCIYRVRDDKAVAMFKRLYVQVSRGKEYIAMEHQRPAPKSGGHCLLTTGTRRGLTMPVGDNWLADLAYAVIAWQIAVESGNGSGDFNQMFVRVGPEHVASVNDYIISAVRFYDDACLLYSKSIRKIQ